METIPKLSFQDPSPKPCSTAGPMKNWGPLLLPPVDATCRTEFQALLLWPLQKQEASAVTRVGSIWHFLLKLLTPKLRSPIRCVWLVEFRSLVLGTREAEKEFSRFYQCTVQPEIMNDVYLVVDIHALLLKKLSVWYNLRNNKISVTANF